MTGWAPLFSAHERERAAVRPAPALAFLDGDPAWRAAIFVLLCLALWVGSAGNRDLPLENHEVYVVQTAQEMHDRGDWIVPYFNGEPRLNKPPLSYWLVGAAAWAAGSLDHIEAWQGRLPSVLAGVGLVFLTLRLGAMLYGRGTALVAALILVSSLGFFSYTHNARPDLLYAFWCSAGYTAFVEAWLRPGRARPARLAAYGMWLCYALATLTKGPHLPGMLLAASALFAVWRRRSWRDLAEVFRPLLGLVLFLLVIVPWGWLMWRSVGPERLAASQLSGRLLTVDWKRLAGLSYVYTTWMMILPWALLVPPAAYTIARGRWREPATGLLLLLVAVPMVVLSMGSQARWFYMLPVLVPVCLLLAAALVGLWGLDMRSAGRRWFHGLIVVHWLLAGAWLAFASATPTVSVAAHSTAGWLAVLFACAAGAAWACRTFMLRHPWTGVAASAALVSAVLTSLGGTTLLWGHDRYDHRRLARSAAAAAGADVPLVALGVNPAVYVYYGGRPIRAAHSIARALSALQGRDGRLVVIVKGDALDALPNGVERTVLDSAPGDEAGEGHAVVLLRVPGDRLG